MPKFSHAVASSLISRENPGTPALPLSIDPLATKGKKNVGRTERYMATTSIQTIETRVSRDDNGGFARSGQLANRNQDLASYGQQGYTLAHTAVIEGTEFVTFVDTLTRIND